MHDEDAIGAHHGRQPVRDDHRRAPLQQRVERALQPALGDRIDRRGRLVQHEDVGVFDDRAREAEQLPLAHREVPAPLGELGRVALGHVAQHLLGLHHLQRPVERRVRDVIAQHLQVLAERAGEEVDVLQHEPDRAAPRLLAVVADVDAVERDPPRGRLVEAQQEIRHRRLAAAREPDEGHLLAAADAQAHAIERARAAVVDEAHVLEGDLAPGLGHGLDRIGPVGRARRGVEHAEDAIGRGERALDEVELLRELDQRPEEPARVLDEEHERADGHRRLEDLRRADVDDHHHRRDLGRGERRPERVLDQEEPDLFRILVAVEARQIEARLLGVPEDLQDRDALHVLDQEGRDAGVELAHGARGASDVLEEEVGPEHKRRHQREQREGHARVGHHHHRKGAGEEDHVAQQRERDIREEHHHLLDVALDARHQPPGRVLVEVGERKRQHVLEDLLPQPRDDLQPHAPEQDHLDVRQAHAAREEQHVEDRAPEHAVGVTGGDVLVEQVADDERSAQLGRDRADEQQRRDEDPAAVWAEQRHHAAQHVAKAQVPGGRFLFRLVVVVPPHGVASAG